MKKAKSRLKIDHNLENSSHSASRIDLGERAKHLPTLIIGLFFAVVLLGLILLIPPAQVKNFILPNSYFPFFITLFLSSFFLLSWFLLDSLIGVWWSLWLTTLVFLRVQQIIFGWPELVFFALGFALGVMVQIWRRQMRLDLVHHQN
ncbi:hypothetical protein KJZ63_03375 [Patescibacteria group bacterium]|nr:hypothetical protein [Patescibacteria group bacterium]